MSRLLSLVLFSSATLLAALPQAQPFRRPLVFEPNRGQFPAPAKWVARGSGYDLLFTDDGVAMVLRDGPGGTAGRKPGSYTVLRMKLDGSRPWSNLTGLDPTGGVSNYLRGENPQIRQANIPHYARVRAAGVYDGVDLVFYDRDGRLEYDFVVAPGAGPRKIRMAFEGMERMRVDQESGDLVLTTAHGAELRQARPQVYQQIGGQRVEIGGGYELRGHGRVAFTLTGYDSRHPLVIDPTVAFINIFGGNGSDGANAIAVDSGGNSYVTGWTNSDNFPTLNAYDPQLSSCDSHSFGGFCTATTDAFVTKLSPSGGIMFSTYFGSHDGDEGTGIAIDSTGVYVTGSFGSWSEPTSGNVFVMRLSLTGSAVYVRFYGGAGRDFGNAIALDSQHNAWVTGSTFSGDFPLKNGEFATYSGGLGDAFVLEVSPAGNLLFSERLAGTGMDIGQAIAVDRNDSTWITGETCSPAFPGTNSFFLCAVFVTKISGQRINFTTLLPGTGSGVESGLAIATDGAEAVYVAGYTNNANFPTTQGAFQNAIGPSYESGFITRLNSLGQVLNSTYLGGNGISHINGIALDSGSAVYVTGKTSGTDFPGAPGLTPSPTVGFLCKLSPDLNTLFYTVLLGDTGNAVGISEANPVVNSPHIYVAGYASYNSSAFVDRLDEGPFVRLRNFWKSDQYINIEGGTPASGPIAPGWWSAQWELVLRPTTNGDPAGENVFWIQNRWHPDQYLNVESGQLQSTAVGPGWLSARWTFEPVPGTHLYRIRNVWQPARYLNIESGALVAGPILTTGSPFPPGWWSAMWAIERPY